MSDTAHKPTLSRVWAGYLLSEAEPHVWRVIKVDAHGRPEESYRVAHGNCDCKGFQSHLDCRHVKLVQHRPDRTTRRKAREVATEVIEQWDDRLVMMIDGYDVKDGDEDDVREVILRAKGDPIEFDGRKHWTILGVRKGVYVRINIGNRGSR